MTDKEELPDFLKEKQEMKEYMPPAGYFEQMQVEVMAKIKVQEAAPVKMLRLHPILKWAVAAVLVIAFGLSAIYLYVQSGVVENSNIAVVSDEDLYHYVHTNIDEFPIALLYEKLPSETHSSAKTDTSSDPANEIYDADDDYLDTEYLF